MLAQVVRVMQHLPGIPPAGKSRLPLPLRCQKTAAPKAPPLCRRPGVKRLSAQRTESAFPQTAHTVCPLKTPNSAVPELDTPCIIKKEEQERGRPGLALFLSQPENASGEAW